MFAIKLVLNYVSNESKENVDDFYINNGIADSCHYYVIVEIIFTLSPDNQLND